MLNEHDQARDDSDLVLLSLNDPSSKINVNTWPWVVYADNYYLCYFYTDPDQLTFTLCMSITYSHVLGSVIIHPPKFTCERLDFWHKSGIKEHLAGWVSFLSLSSVGKLNYFLFWWVSGQKSGAHDSELLLSFTSLLSLDSSIWDPLRFSHFFQAFVQVLQHLCPACCPTHCHLIVL